MDVSIIIPADKDRGFLRDAIASCERQTFRGSYEIIVQMNNVTLGKNVNDGFMASTGEWIKVLAEDDLLAEDAIHNLWTFAQGGYDWVYGDAMQFEGDIEDDKFSYHRSRPWFTLEELLKDNVMNGGAQLYKRSVFERTGGWDENLWTGEEYDWHLLLTHWNFQRGYVPKIVLFQRMHTDSKYNYFEANHGQERRNLIESIRKRYV